LAGEAVRRAGATSSAYDDADIQLVWIRDQRAIALRGLGRWNESIEELLDASRMPEQRSENVSQAINLALVYCAFNRPKEALAAIDGVIPNVSPYGRMLVERVRFVAGLELNDRHMAADALGYLKQHRSDAIGALQGALLEANQADEGSRLLLSRLADPKLRNEALVQVQRYVRPPLPPRVQQWQARWEALLERPEVQTAIAKVGRTERYELPPSDY